MEPMNFQDDKPSILTDFLKDHYVLVFNSTSKQDGTEHCNYPGLVGEPLRLELFFFALEHATEFIVLGERISSVAVDKFDVLGKKIFFG